MTAEKNSEPGFVISRLIDAPCEVVWEAITDSRQVVKWWGPNGFISTIHEMDVRVDGVWKHTMRGPDGTEYLNKSIFKQIVKPEKIVFVNSFSDEKGGLTRHPFSPTWPIEMLTTIRFSEDHGKTTVDIQWLPIEANEEERKTFDEGRDSMKQGWTGTLDQLTDYLAALKKTQEASSQ